MVDFLKQTLKTSTKGDAADQEAPFSSFFANSATRGKFFPMPEHQDTRIFVEKEAKKAAII